MKYTEEHAVSCAIHVLRAWKCQPSTKKVFDVGKWIIIKKNGFRYLQVDSDSDGIGTPKPKSPFL